MAKLNDKVTHVLDESRMMVLAAQVVLGFQFRSFLEPGFEQLPLPTQLVKLVGLGLLMLAVGLLIAPSSYHRIVERGEDSDEIHRYASKLLTWAMLPFALGLGIDLFVATEKVFGRWLGVAAGLLAALTAVAFWYALEFYQRRERADEIASEKRKSEEEGQKDKQEQQEKGEGGMTKLSDKIKHVLTEARVVLPGAQALLGFQFVAVLTEAFDKLPQASKYVHLASLGLIAVTIVLLMTPAAYHRIVEQGEDTEHFHRFASKMVVAALVPLALGICGEVYVVTQKVVESHLVAVVFALVGLALFWELWFGLTLYRRTQRDYAR
jgi:DMSO reductase anchor subunit